MPNAITNYGIRPAVEALESRTLASASRSLTGRDVFETYRTHTVLTVEAGALGQPITFDATVFADDSISYAGVNLYYRGRLFQALALGLTPVASSDPRFAWANETTYTIPAGLAEAETFGVGPHVVRAWFPRQTTSSFTNTFLTSSAVAVFRVTRPQFSSLPPGVSVATLAAGSGPPLQPGQTATVQFNAYWAASYHLFYTTESQTPDTQSFTVDASPEQVIPGLDAGVIGMQAGETRAIYIPFQLGYGTKGGPHVPRRANLVYLVTLVSIA